MSGGIIPNEVIDVNDFLQQPNEEEFYGIKTLPDGSIHPGFLKGFAIAKEMTTDIVEGDKIGSDGSIFGKFQSNLIYEGTTMGGIDAIVELSNGQWLAVDIVSTSQAMVYLLDRTDDGFEFVDSLSVTGMSSFTTTAVGDLSANKAILLVNNGSAARYLILDYASNNLSITINQTNFGSSMAGMAVRKYSDTKAILCDGDAMYMLTYDFGNNTVSIGTGTQLFSGAGSIDVKTGILKFYDNVFFSFHDDYDNDNGSLVKTVVNPTTFAFTCTTIATGTRNAVAKVVAKVGNVLVLHHVRSYNGVTRYFNSWTVATNGTTTAKSSFTDGVNMNSYEGNNIKGGTFIIGNVINYVYQDGSFVTTLTVNPDGTITLSEGAGISFGTKIWVYDNNNVFGFPTGSIVDGVTIMANGLKNIFIGIALYSGDSGDIIPILVSGVSKYESGLSPGSYYKLGSSGEFESESESYAGRKFYALSATEIII